MRIDTRGMWSGTMCWWDPLGLRVMLPPHLTVLDAVHDKRNVSEGGDRKRGTDLLPLSREPAEDVCREPRPDGGAYGRPALQE
jgi:hypothetical protein